MMPCYFITPSLRLSYHFATKTYENDVATNEFKFPEHKHPDPRRVQMEETHWVYMANANMRQVVQVKLAHMRPQQASMLKRMAQPLYDECKAKGLISTEGNLNSIENKYIAMGLGQDSDTSGRVLFINEIISFPTADETSQEMKDVDLKDFKELFNIKNFREDIAKDTFSLMWPSYQKEFNMARVRTVHYTPCRWRSIRYHNSTFQTCH